MTRGMPHGAPDLLVDRRGSLMRAAVVDPAPGPDRLLDLAIDRDGTGPRAGAVLRGRVLRVFPDGDFAFVDVGTAEPGLLSGADVRPVPRSGPRREGRGVPLTQRLRAGDTVLVQVRTAARSDRRGPDADGDGGPVAGAAKGPGLTMDVTLPGRFVVHAPFRDDVVVSRRLAQGPQRQALTRRLRELTAGEGWGAGGWIVRASAAQTGDAVLAAEIEYLATTWHGLVRRTDAAPVRLADGPTAPQRLIVERAGRPLGRIVAASAALADDLRAWCAAAAPDLVTAVTVDADPPGPFEMADLDTAIAALAHPEVPLPGGGSLTFERTRALWVVDVDGGPRRDRAALNLAAVGAIARQLRLRNVGGVVVVDFVTPDHPAERERLVHAMSGAVADDPAATHVYGMSKLGLMELVRTRRGPDLLDLLGGGEGLT